MSSGLAAPHLAAIAPAQGPEQLLPARLPQPALPGTRLFQRLLPGRWVPWRLGPALACCLSWLALFFAPVVLPGWAAAGPETPPGTLLWELTADSLTHFDQPRRTEARGNVVLKRAPQAEEGAGTPLRITADWMSYDPASGVAEARGRVLIFSAGEEISARAAALHLESGTGTLEQATVQWQENDLYLKGQLVEKTGPDSYYLEEAWLSACRPDDPDCAPAWSFTGRRARITLEGMAHVYHATFRVRDQPLLYSPYLLLPAKTRRQTGFLFPEISHSGRDGSGLSLPFFINLAPSADITLYPRYLGQRGLLAGAEFRYAAAPGSRGTLLAGFLRDRLTDAPADEYRGDGLLRETRNRYWVRGKLDHDFGADLTARADLDLTSDQDFIAEFNSGSQGYARNNRDFTRTFGRDLAEPSLTTRRSTLQLTKITPRSLLAGEIMVQQDTSHSLLLDGAGVPQPLDRPRTPLQALPRLNHSGRTPLAGVPLPLSLAWNNEYVHYWRSRGIAAQRLDLHPRLITAMPRFGGWTEGRLGVGLRQTMYQVSRHGAVAPQDTWNHDRYQDRTALDFEANLATTLVREFALAPFAFGRGPQAEAGQAGEGARLEHLFRPNLIYTHLARTSEARLPDLDGLDRLARKNWLTYELNNYFELLGAAPAPVSAAGGGIDGESAANFSSRFLAFFKVIQSYDLAAARQDLGPGHSRREFSDLRFDFRASPLPRLDFRYQANLSMYGQGVTRHELLGGYSLENGARLALNYRFLKYSEMIEPFFYTTVGERRDDIGAEFFAPLTEKISLHGLLNHDLRSGHSAEAALGLTYKPHCWALDFQLRRYVDEKSVMVVFSLDSIGDFLGLTKKGI